MIIIKYSFKLVIWNISSEKLEYIIFLIKYDQYLLKSKFSNNVTLKYSIIMFGEDIIIKSVICYNEIKFFL